MGVKKEFLRRKKICGKKSARNLKVKEKSWIWIQTGRGGRV
jgi:hypothetical protein